MERNVRFLLNGKRVAGYLMGRNSKTIHARLEPFGKILFRRIDKHKVEFAPPGVEFSKDDSLPRWYIAYQKFLEARK